MRFARSKRRSVRCISHREIFATSRRRLWQAARSKLPKCVSSWRFLAKESAAFPVRDVSPWREKVMTPKLAFTCGDPAGIGPEIIAAWLAANAVDAANVALIGPASWLASLATDAQKIPVGLEEFVATSGQPSGEGALVAWAAMERAA